MKPHERFFQKDIARIERVKEQAIDDAYEIKQRKVVERFFEEIKSGRAVLLEDALEVESWSRTPPIGSCFSYADGSRLDPLLDALAEERKAKLKQLHEEVKQINRSIILGDLDKPTLLRMLTEFEAFGETSDVTENLPPGSLPRLVAIGNSVVNAIKAVRQHTGWDLKESKQFVDSAPIDFPVLDRQTTLALIEDLRKSGAVVEIPKVNTLSA